MSEDRDAKVILVDTNLFFVRRLTDELHKDGFGVLHCSEPAYALTAVEWTMPVAILCATNLPNSDVYTIPRIVQSDERTRHIAVVAIGDSGQQPLLAAFRAGYDDFVERRIGARQTADHLVAFLLSRNSFQFSQADARQDLLSVIRSLSHRCETGALRVRAAGWEGIIFFKSGMLIHGECEEFTGDAAVLHMIETCNAVENPIYKFMRGCAIPAYETVEGTAEELIHHE